MNKLAPKSFEEPEWKLPDQRANYFSWWPEGLVTWNEAVFRIAHALFGSVDWGVLRTAEEDLHRVLSDTSERIADLMAQGQQWPDSPGISSLDQQAASAWRRRGANLQTAFTWIGRYQATDTMLARMGSLGRIPSAVVVFVDGSVREVSELGWTSPKNGEHQRRQGQFDPGDAPCAQNGALCVPVETVDAWCKTIGGQPAMTLDIAAAMLMGAKREEQGWKKFVAEHRWTPLPNGKMSRREARRLAKIAKPWVIAAAEIERTARSIQGSVNPRSPGNKKKPASNTRQQL